MSIISDRIKCFQLNTIAAILLCVSINPSEFVDTGGIIDYPINDSNYIRTCDNLPPKDYSNELMMSSKGMKSKPGWLDKLKISLKSLLGMNTIVCDSCKWDWRGACHHPERPNAVWCPDYEKRGK